MSEFGIGYAWNPQTVVINVGDFVQVSSIIWKNSSFVFSQLTEERKVKPSTLFSTAFTPRLPFLNFLHAYMSFVDFWISVRHHNFWEILDNDDGKLQ